MTRSVILSPTERPKALPRRPLGRGLALSFVLTVGLAGCKQGEGERCQVSSDCQDDLICVLPVGGTPQSGGLCASVNGVDMASGADFAVPDDLSVVD
jgi:hypothetical protein